MSIYKKPQRNYGGRRLDDDIKNTVAGILHRVEQ